MIGTSDGEQFETEFDHAISVAAKTPLPTPDPRGRGPIIDLGNVGSTEDYRRGTVESGIREGFIDRSDREGIVGYDLGIVKKQIEKEVIKKGDDPDPAKNIIPFRGFWDKDTQRTLDEYNRGTDPDALRKDLNKSMFESPSKYNERRSDISPDLPIAGQQYAMFKREQTEGPIMDPLSTEIERAAGSGIQARGGTKAGGELKLQPSTTGGAGTGTYGYASNKKSFDFIKDDKIVGGITITPKNEGKDLHVDMIQADWNTAGGRKNAFGPANMRGLLRQLKEEYPEAERLYGFRISGGREKAQQAVQERFGSNFDIKRDETFISLKPGVSAKAETEFRIRKLLPEEVEVKKLRKNLYLAENEDTRKKLREQISSIEKVLFKRPREDFLQWKSLQEAERLYLK